jgi:hypothetical protein
MPLKNTGFLFQEPSVTDFVAGEATGIIPDTRLASADWSPYLPTEESQCGVYGDTYACVSFSALNVVETQMNMMLMGGLIPDATLQWLIDNGYIEARA